MKNNKGIYILDLAKKYGIERRTAAGRLERNGIKGFMIGRRMYYILTPEIDEILKQPVKPHAPFTKKKVRDVNEATPKKTTAQSVTKEKIVKTELTGKKKENKSQKHIHVKLTGTKPSKPTYEFNEDAPVFSVIISVK